MSAHEYGFVTVNEGKLRKRRQEEVSVYLLDFLEACHITADNIIAEESDAVVCAAFPVMEVLLSAEVRAVTGEKGDILFLDLLPDFLKSLFSVMLLNQGAQDFPVSSGIDDVYVPVELKFTVLHTTHVSLV